MIASDLIICATNLEQETNLLIGDPSTSRWQRGGEGYSVVSADVRDPCDLDELTPCCGLYDEPGERVKPIIMITEVMTGQCDVI